MLDPEQLEQLCKPHGLHAAALRRIGCSQNEVFEHGEGDDRLILRVSHGRGRTVDQVETELDWIEELARQGVHVCRPRTSRWGRRCERLVLSGTEYLVVCFDRAPGRKIEPADVDDSLYARLGQLTARLHAGSFDGPPVKEAWHRPLWHESRLLTHELDRHPPGHARVFRAAVRQLIEELKPSVNGNLGLVHADITFSNTFLDGERLWIFDFDNCELGSIAQDLATILYDSIYCRLLNRVPTAELASRITERWGAFLDGYRGIRALEPIETELLRRFLILREAIIYIHYCRTLDQNSLTNAWRAGMDQMRLNVERSVTQIELQGWGRHL